MANIMDKMTEVQREQLDAMKGDRLPPWMHRKAARLLAENPAMGFYNARTLLAERDEYIKRGRELARMFGTAKHR